MGLKVRAKDTGEKYSGVYGHRRRRPGDVFELESIIRIRKDKDGNPREVTITEQQQFSERWMERVDAGAPPVSRQKKEKPEPAVKEDAL